MLEPGENVPTSYSYDPATNNLKTVGDSAGTTTYVYYANGSDIWTVGVPRV